MARRIRPPVVCLVAPGDLRRSRWIVGPSSKPGYHASRHHDSDPINNAAINNAAFNEAITNDALNEGGNDGCGSDQYDPGRNSAQTKGQEVALLQQSTVEEVQTVRVIPCLDVDDGRVVKGVNFVGLRDAGDPVDLAAQYDTAGADEIVFLDITATSSERATMIDVVARTAEHAFIPLTVGGGIRSVDDARRLLRAGCDKVSINSSAIANPLLINDLSVEFGSQAVVVSIDARMRADGSGYEVFVAGGRTATGLDAIAWAVEATQRGAGEIMLTSMDLDGTRDGFDLVLTRKVVDAVGVPVVASGGVGNVSHLVEGATIARASAVLAASIFHFGEVSIAEAKTALAAAGVRVRPNP